MESMGGYIGNFARKGMICFTGKKADFLCKQIGFLPRKWDSFYAEKMWNVLKRCFPNIRREEATFQSTSWQLVGWKLFANIISIIFPCVNYYDAKQ